MIDDANEHLLLINSSSLYAMLCTRKYGSGRSEVRITRTEKGSVVVVGPYKSEAKKVHSLPA